jgi:3-oxoacyl-[acyl-carrier protein] reductase
MARREKPEYIASILKSIPLGRPGTVEEIANAVIFLSSPLSSYISGVNLVVDGSMSIGF